MIENSALALREREREEETTEFASVCLCIYDGDKGDIFRSQRKSLCVISAPTMGEKVERREKERDL